MIVVRPIQPEDLAQLLVLAKESGTGFTSLPVNEALLQRKVALSQSSFAGTLDNPSQAYYLMVGEDSDTQQIVGTTAIEAAVGSHSPLYHYHLGQVIHCSHQLGVHNAAQILTLNNDYTGTTEICTLFVREAFRRGMAGRLLSRCRFMLMAEHCALFASIVIAEMRGVSDENGRSPFWAWLEQHFFSLDFPTADYLTGLGNKQFIAELMPKYPIYVSLLSPQAQQVIGKVHDKTQPALALLEKEGFYPNGYVDIFDAGPTVQCHLSHIRSVQTCLRLQVDISQPIAGQQLLMSNISLGQYRAVAASGSIAIKHSKVVINQATANALGVNQGDTVRVLTLL
ncbi:arginine N-succinyltransferase [Motilimonas pumila]|uniref:Arginine N-succinyltransferase n=1 Tax=Motilimonas pumila TaxID=2303987 RepID=A0A418YCT7_9GAMM|nr:arginine N-succinyltransferase [Motilimonas pumila]RJG42339.1 arginine N-succinyltransferase [Motilimonas pumila]